MAREAEWGRVVVQDLGSDRYELLASEKLSCAPTELWELLCDWERFVLVGLPGMTSDFRWVTGGPRQYPSKFQFDVAGAVLKEEIYELTADEGTGRYRVCYRALEPALGVLEYDAVLDVASPDGTTTVLDTKRIVRLESGSGPEMLAGMIDGEMRSLKDHFAGD